MLDLSQFLTPFSQIRPATPPPNPLDQYGKVLSLADTASQIQQRQASAQKDQLGQQKIQSIQKILSDPASHDPVTGRVTQDAQNKLQGVDPEWTLGLQKSYLEADDKKAKNDIETQNAKTEAAKAAETARHNQAEEAKLDPAQQDYQAFLKSTGRPDNEMSQFLHKTMGTKVTPGETVMGGGNIPNFTVPEKSVAPKVNFSNDGIPMSVTDADKSEYVIGDPKMPAALQPIATAAVGAHHQRLMESAQVADQLSAKQDARAQAASARSEALKNSTAPEQVKTLVNSGYMTSDTIKDVQDLMKAHPDLVGPALGRAEQFAQGAGTSFGLQDPEKERAAAQLSKNFADLMVNEAKTASPGRGQKEILDMVKASSAKMAQDPNIIQGFLTGAQQSAARAIQSGKRWGIDISGSANQPQGQTTVKVINGKQYNVDSTGKVLSVVSPTPN